MEERLSNVINLQKEISRKKKRTVHILYIVIILIIISLAAMLWSEGPLAMLFPAGLLLAGTALLLPSYIRMGVMHKSLQELTEEEQRRVNEDVLTGYRCANVIVCRDCLLFVVNNIQALPYRDIVFAFGRSTTYTAAIAAVATVNNIVVVDKRKKQYFMNMGIKPFWGNGQGAFQTIDAKMMFAILQQNAPWSFFGASKENMALFNHFKKMAAAAEERKRQYFAAAGGAQGTERYGD